MAASSYTWAGKKLTPKELTNSLRTDPLPLVVKVVQVPNDYERSCPQMASGKILWIYELAPEERVALKTTDKTNKYISLPLEAPIKFEVVYTHDRGPPTLLSSLLRGGKVKPDLRVEISGNAGNRLSSTPDQTQSVPYGSLQVFGIYKETILHAQTITNATGELNPQRRNLSVNCPVILDIATGLKGKSADDFRKFKDRLKQNQSSKVATQADTSYDMVLLTNPQQQRSMQDFSQLLHSCHLHVHQDTTTASSTQEEEDEDEEEKSSSATFVAHALQQLQKSSKQVSIPQVQDKITTSSGKLTNALSKEVPREDGLSKQGKKGKESNNAKCYYVIVDDPKPKPSEYVNESDQRVSDSKPSVVAAAPGIYLNGNEPVFSSAVKELWPLSSINAMSGSKLESSPATYLAAVGQYVNEMRPDQMRNGKQPKETNPVKSPQQPLFNSADNVSLTSEDYEDVDLPVYEDIPIAKNDKSNTLSRPAIPLPPVPSEATERRKSWKNPFGGRKQKQDSIPDADISDDGEYTEPNDEELEQRKPSTDEAPKKDDRKWNTLSDVPKKVKEFSISDVSFCLELLKLHEYVAKFRERNVDGRFLLKMTKKMMMQSFEMQEFEAKLLYEFAVKKWRPKK